MKNLFVIKIVICGVVLSSILLFPFILDITLLPRFLGLGVCIALAVYYCMRSQVKLSLKPDFILLAGLGYCLFTCLSVLWSTARSEAMFEASKQVLFFSVFLLSYFSLKQAPGYFFKALLKISILLFAFIFLVAFFQIKDLQGFNKDSLYLVSGINGHKNLLSSFLFLNLFFLLCSAKELEKPWSLSAMICVVLNLALLVFLRTKAVWAGMAVGIAVLVFLYLFSRVPKTKKTAFKLFLPLSLTMVLVNIFFFVFLQPLVQKSMRFTTSLKQATNETASMLQLEEERLVLWDKTYHLIHQKPLIGVGAGNWQTHLPDATLVGLWRGEELNYTFQRPHNDFLWIISELGFIGFNFYLLFLLGIIFSALKVLRLVPGDTFLRYRTILGIAFIVGYMVISFFDFPKERIEHGLWFSLILGITYYSARTHLSLKTFGEIKLHGTLLFTFLVFMLLIVFIGLLRFTGEFHTRRMYNYKNSNRLPELISSGNTALSYAYSVDPTSIPIYWYTGNAKASMGNYNGAQQDFLKAYQLAPYNRNVLNDLASSLVFTNDVLSAKKYYEEAARISPRFDEPKLNLAAMYINANDFKTATFWLNSLMHNSERRTNYETIVGIKR